LRDIQLLFSGLHHYQLPALRGKSRFDVLNAKANEPIPVLNYDGRYLGVC
jgi:hypothetical protein